jgi:hypothetical protein
MLGHSNLVIIIEFSIENAMQFTNHYNGLHCTALHCTAENESKGLLCLENKEERRWPLYRRMKDPMKIEVSKK